MGWNTGYKIFEETVIGAYDLGLLNKELLIVLMNPFRNSDIDSGGSQNLHAKDGKNIEEIVVETWGLNIPTKPEGEYKDNPDAWDGYLEDIGVKFMEITDSFGWY